MNLFQKIPDSFFSILSSRNKHVYGLALVTLYEALVMYRNRIRKSDYLDLLKARAEKEVALLVYEDEEEIENDPSFFEPSLANKASFVLKRLVDTGWVYIETNVKTGAEYLLLPSYAIGMLKILYEFVDAEENKYVSYVHTTYSDLKLEDEQQDDFMYRTLTSAFFNTKELEIEVAKLDHSIRVFQKQLATIFSPNEVLNQHFDQCREDVVDPIYHPLKTNDSIVLYHGPITAILKRWLTVDSVREKLVAQALKDNHAINTKEDAELDIVRKINFIQDTYARLSTEIGEIDKTQSDYIKASTEKVIYLNNSDKTIRGKLETIFLALAKVVHAEEGLDKRKQELMKSVIGSIPLFEQGFINEESLMRPIHRTPRFESEPLLFDDETREPNATLMQTLLSMNERYGEDSIFDFMERQFKEKNQFSIREVPLDEVENFLLIILGTVKANARASFYAVERPQQENTQIRVDQCIVPDLSYIKKGEHHV